MYKIIKTGLWASILLIILGFLILSCEKRNFSEIAKITYYNYSKHTINQIVLDLIPEGPRSAIDRIEINTSIPAGDSLHFEYNTEYILSSQGGVKLYTRVLLDDNIWIYNSVLDTLGFETPGYFGRNQNSIQMVYIGNSNIMFCTKLRPEYQYLNLKPSPCSPNLFWDANH